MQRLGGRSFLQDGPVDEKLAIFLIISSKSQIIVSFNNSNHNRYHGRPIAAFLVMGCSLPCVWMLFSSGSWNPNPQQFVDPASIYDEEYPPSVEPVSAYFGLYTTGIFLFLITLLQTCSQMILARPLLAEIAPPKFCARVVAYTCCIESMIGAIAPGVVATISEDIFGYAPSRLEMTEISSADRFSNADALRKSFLVTQVIGIIGTMICFVLINSTVREDVQNASRSA